MKLRAILLAGVVFFTACKKSPVSIETRSSTVSPQLPMPSTQSPPSGPDPARKDSEAERALTRLYGNDVAKKKELRTTMKAFDAEIDAGIKLAEINRRTMVIPAPADFKPEAVDSKVRLRLILEKEKMRPGDFVRFRLEMTNVGRQAIDFVEYKSSLFKYGGLNDTDKISFFVTDSLGRRVKLDGASASAKVRERKEKHPESKYEFLPGKEKRTESKFESLPESMSKQDKEEWLEQTQAMSAASTHFQVKLLPGETLRSRGDGESTGETFRTLWCDQDFDRKGHYKLEVVLDDRPKPMGKIPEEALLRSGGLWEKLQEIDAQRIKNAVGLVSSNVVSFEVAP